jgi:hypothetical protein
LRPEGLTRWFSFVGDLVFHWLCSTRLYLSRPTAICRLTSTYKHQPLCSCLPWP